MDNVENKSTVIEKKLFKKNKLFDAAYELFISRGINQTAIDDIVKKAGVAKGTFYLYFKDKYDIMDRIILKKSSYIIKEAMDATIKMQYGSFIDAMVFFIDYIIEYFKNNKMLLKIIYKNLSWGLYRKALIKSDENEEMQEVKNLLFENMKREGFDDNEIEKIIFMVVELTGSVIYSSIILEEPDTIDNMKETLFNTIKKMLTR